MRAVLAAVARVAAAHAADARVRRVPLRAAPAALLAALAARPPAAEQRARPVSRYVYSYFTCWASSRKMRVGD